MCEVPRVTIITPTFNRAALLPETIESILGQNYPNLEYIIVDDGSSDDTRDVVARFDTRVTYLRQTNQGEAAAVNRGWNCASGDFVCVVSSDDPQPKNLIRRSVDVMRANPEVIVTYPDWVIIDENSELVETIKVPDYNYEEMLRTCRCLPGPGSFMRRAAITPHIQLLRDPRYPLISDLECWWRLGLLGPFLHIRETLGAWRQHSGAATVKLWQSKEMARQHTRMAWDFYAQPTLPLHVRKLERKSKGRMLIVASTMTRGPSLLAAARYALRALWYIPRSATRQVLELLLEIPSRSVGVLKKIAQI